jgi:hypothetical protein
MKLEIKVRHKLTSGGVKTGHLTLFKNRVASHE